MINLINKFLPKDELKRNITVLAGSAAFAQTLSVLVMPILTRLYDPADFGVVALFGSVVALLLVVATLRYEWAIPNPIRDEDAINLLMVCFLIICLVAIISVLIMIAFFGKLENFPNLSAVRPYLWLVPLYILGGASYQTLNAWAIRKKNFTSIAKTRFSQSITGSIINIGLGFLKSGPIGLLLGGLASQTAGIGTLASLLWKNDRKVLTGIRKRNIVFFFKHYLKFATLSTGASIANTASLQMTTILLTAYFEVAVVGWYYLAQRIIGIPTGLISQATAQTFWAEAARMIQSDPKGLRKLFLKFSRKLTLLSLLVALLGISCPFVFGFIFGSAKWNMAGFYALYLTPMFMSQFIFGTLSHLAVHELQHWQLIWDICRLLLIVLCFWMAHRLGWTAGVSILIYSIMMSGMYFILYIMNLNALQIKIKARQENL